MGKATIISGGAGGLYTAELVLNWTRIDRDIATLTTRIAALNARLPGLSGDEYDRAAFQAFALQKRKSYLEEYKSLHDSPRLEAWCADLTENLTGEVGTCEIPGERGVVQIRPGYTDAAAYNKTRDGTLQRAIAAAPSTCFYNLALLPGWQKWKPTYRHAIITAIDYAADTCDVDLEAAESSAQGLGLNQTGSLSAVPIEYMDTDSEPFAVGDAVLVEFQSQDWNQPRVIGFKDHPKHESDFYLILTIDGNELAFGGQKVRLKYTDTDGNAAETDWVTTPTAVEQLAGATRGLAGPFGRDDIDITQPITVEVDGQWDKKYWPDAVNGTWWEIQHYVNEHRGYYPALHFMSETQGHNPTFYHYIGGPYRYDFYAAEIDYTALTFARHGEYLAAEIDLTFGILGPYDIVRRDIFVATETTFYSNVQLQTCKKEVVLIDWGDPYSNFATMAWELWYVSDYFPYSHSSCSGSQLDASWSGTSMLPGVGTTGTYTCTRSSPVDAHWF